MFLTYWILGIAGAIVLIGALCTEFGRLMIAIIVLGALPLTFAIVLITESLVYQIPIYHFADIWKAMWS